jgi:hypothetical protein
VLPLSLLFALAVSVGGGGDCGRIPGGGAAGGRLGFGILSRSSYAVVVFMPVATTLVAPPLIKIAYRSLLESGGEQYLDRLG